MCIGVAPPTKGPWPHPVIAREGWPFLGGAFVLALLASLFSGPVTIALGWIIFAFVLQFFRDPARRVPEGAGLVLVPADGRIVAVEKTRDPWLEREALKISVFMNVFNVHSNRSPVDGEVRQRWYNPGKFVNADLDKASTENERNALHIRATTGHDITCVQVAGLIARRILCYVEPGAQLVRGQRYGFIRFGSRVDLYLPTDVRVKVTIGDKVRATSTILAELQ
jgi:phosphatidylserine decarboxylase